jgi:membrane fusion protein (multidrug efflux system)
VFAGAALAGLVCLSALSGCGGGDQAGPGGGGAGGGFRPPPTPVEVADVREGPIEDRFQTVGSIEAAEEIVVVSEINGTVRSLPFEEGGRIEQGGVIAQLDDAELRAEVARAEAVREQRQSAFERVRAVVEQRAGAAQDLDDARAALHVAEAELALARARLAKTRIVAPFGGHLGARHVSPGAFVRAGDPITELARVSEIEVRFTAPERFVGKLERGAEVAVATAAFPDRPLTGHIEVVSPVVDAATRSVLVIARAPNPGERARPGMSADVTVVLSRRARALSIPAEAVFAQGTVNLVYVVTPDSTVTRTPVHLGTRLANAVEILSGLEPGQQVVRAGHQKLYDGARVMPVMSQPGGGNPGGAGGAPGGGDQAGGDQSGGDQPGGDQAGGDGADRQERTAARGEGR